MCRVVSCGSGDQRWSTKLYLGSGESLEDHHRSCTLGAEPKIVAALGACGILLGLRCRAEQLKAKRQASGPPPVGQKTEMANAYEAVWKQVQQKATEEFIECERHPPLFVLVGGVPPAKGDFLVGEEEQAVVGDGYAMSVAAQITKHILGASEGWFGVNHPILSKQWPEPRSKGFRLSEQSQVSVEAELAVREGALECRNEFAAEDATEHLDGKKEGVARFDPARAIGRQPTGRHHAMYMRMKFDFLTPGVQHAEEADLCTEMLGIASDFEKRFRTGAQQKIVDDLLVLQRQRGHRTREREDHVHVRGRKKFPATLFQPAVASPGLTLWTVPIAARVVGDGTMSAASAFIEMAAERGSATPRNG